MAGSMARSPVLPKPLTSAGGVSGFALTGVLVLAALPAVVRERTPRA